MPRSFRVALLAACSLACTQAAPAVASDPLRPHQWGLDVVEADAAHQTTTGAGAVVAVVDTGVKADHPDLARNLLPGHDFVSSRDGVAPDGNGHGTHVAGIVAALTGNGIGVESVAPGAKILPVRVLGDDGSGDAATVAAGIDWAANNGADVINLSLGAGVPLVSAFARSEIDDAIDRAVSRGLIVVAAAGNDGFVPFCEQPSAAKILCVGAVDRRRNRSYFSSFGAGVALTAPGGSGVAGTDEEILSTYNDGGYRYLAGTSQATPHVAAVAALLVSEGIRGQAAVQRILATATPAGSGAGDPQYGAGIVDAARAVGGLPRIARAGSAPAGADPPPAGGGSSGGDTAVASRTSEAGQVHARRLQRFARVLRRGIAVSCDANQAGRCTAVATFGGRRIAAGSAEVPAGKRVTMHARLTAAGRRLARRGKPARATVAVTLPGASDPLELNVLLRR